MRLGDVQLHDEWIVERWTPLLNEVALQCSGLGGVVGLHQG